MPPSTPINDVTDSGVANTEHSADFNLGVTMQIKFPNFYNLIRREFGFNAIPVPDSIHSIGALRVPSKVGRAKVHWVAVIVAGLKALWTGANKGFQYKPMDQASEVFPVYGEDNQQIRVPVGTEDFVRAGVHKGLGCHNLSSSAADYLSVPVRPYSALIGNIISGEVKDRFPNFFGGVKIMAIHGVALLVRVTSGLGPSRCSSTVGARLFIAT